MLSYLLIYKPEYIPPLFNVIVVLYSCVVFKSVFVVHFSYCMGCSLYEDHCTHPFFFHVEVALEC